MSGEEQADDPQDQYPFHRCTSLSTCAQICRGSLPADVIEVTEPLFLKGPRSARTRGGERAYVASLQYGPISQSAISPAALNPYFSARASVLESGRGSFCTRSLKGLS